MDPSRSVVLSGFMATGKSTVGKIVARELGLPFLDTDALLEQETGISTGELFAKEGEARFRDREAALIPPLLRDATPRVIAFGGGVVTIPRVRHEALERATVVTLTATPETIAKRATSLADRPNLGAMSPASRASDLLTLRREVYAECHASVPTDGRSPDDVARDVIAIAPDRRDCGAARHAQLRRRDHARTAGGAPAHSLGSAAVEPPRRDGRECRRGAQRLARRGAPGRRSREPRRPHPGVKSTRRARVDREDLGRGAPGRNPTGRPSSSRSVAVSSVISRASPPLRCSAASDACRLRRPCSRWSTRPVGGKTGFDHAAGKNLLGAFSQPTHVLLDVDHLITLPERQRTSGLAEVVKIALALRSGASRAHLRRRRPHREGRPRSSDRSSVRAAVNAKMRVVREDEHETGARGSPQPRSHHRPCPRGPRRLHALAPRRGGRDRDGPRARRSGAPRPPRLPGISEYAAALFTRFGLPTTASRTEIRAAWPYVLNDKKRVRSAVKLPVVTAPGAGRVEVVELSALQSALGL